MPQQVQNPDGVKQEAEAPSLGLSPKAKRETGPNNQEPKGEFLQAKQVPKQVPQEWGRLSSGGRPAWHTQALRVHVQAAHAEGKRS